MEALNLVNDHASFQDLSIPILFFSHHRSHKTAKNAACHKKSEISTPSQTHTKQLEEAEIELANWQTHRMLDPNIQYDIEYARLK